jgi:hypothetical protein
MIFVASSPSHQICNVRFPIPTPQVSCVVGAPFLLLGLHTTTRLQTLVCTSRRAALFPFAATCSINFHARSPARPLVVSWHTVSHRTASCREEEDSIATFLQGHIEPYRPFTSLAMTMVFLGRQTVMRIIPLGELKCIRSARGDRLISQFQEIGPVTPHCIRATFLSR